MLRTGNPRALVCAVSIVFLLTCLFIAVNPVHGYSLRFNKQGQVLVWNQQVIQVEIDTTGGPSAGGAADAVLAGLVVWTSSGVPHKVKTKVAKQPAPIANDGRNVISWAAADWKYGKEVVGMTISMYKQSSGIVTETDIVLNARDHTWAVDPAPGSGHYDIQNVVTHEAGHLFGLGHSTVAEATMFTTTPSEEKAKRSLSADDLTGVAALIQEINSRRPAKADQPEAMAQAIEKQLSPLPDRNTIGCSVGGSTASGSWWIVLGALAGLARLGRDKRRRGRSPLGLRLTCGLSLTLLALLAPSPRAARATVVQQLSLEQLVSRTTVAVRGVVVGARSYRQDGLIYTDHTIQVARCYRGACQRTSVTLQTIGGRVGDLVLEVEGAPRPQLGQAVIVLGRAAQGKIVSIGLSQGLLTMQQVEPNVALRDLRGLDLSAGAAARRGSLERISLQRVEALLDRRGAQRAAP